MTSVSDRMKLKRVSYDTWSTKEQLCLASSVLKSGDQNWMSVSRSLRSIVEKESLRPPEWYSQKSCALQYAHLLENADTPKRKKRESGETTGESIVRRLTQERIAELRQILAYQRNEYQKLKAEVNMLKSGAITDDKLQKMWQVIEQEEREQEQKARAHAVWLAKRQQKQEVASSQAISIVHQRRSGETMEAQETTEPEDDEKKTRGGRSPLLTSLLKSPSPTTQVQTTTSAVQASSPTITSLLGTSPKVPNTQISQNVSPQLHPQLLPTAISTTNSDRPSAGAPTLSMLLEMPANAQRGPLPNLQTSTTIVSQQNVSTEVRNFQPQSVQVPIQNKVPIPTSAATIIAQNTNIPATESMVQIIDHIDDVIRKDIMTDVMDKDEINEIIGDIEELIKEEIKGSPQSLDTSASTAAINTLPQQTLPQEQKTLVVQEKLQPRDVDEAVSLSNSPQSEMAIEEIDSSTSNIAEIIGTVAIKPQEPKVVGETYENVSHIPGEIKLETNVSEKTISEKLASHPEKSKGETNKTISAKEKQINKFETTDSILNAETKERNSKVSQAKEPVKTTTEEETKENQGTEVSVNKKESSDSAKKQAKSSEETEHKGNAELDQLEMHLAKITGEQQVVSSAEVVGVSSEVPNELPSTEDTEQSQDISLILEDDESAQSSEGKKKVTEEQIIENTIECTKSLESSFKEEPDESAKNKSVEVKEEPSVTKEKSTEESLTIYKEVKKEDMKDSLEGTGSFIVQDIDVKEEKIEESSIAEESTQLSTKEELENKKKKSKESAKPSSDGNKSKSLSKPPATIKESPKAEEETNSQVGPFLAQEKVKKEEPVQVKEEKEEIKKSSEIEVNVKKETESVTSASEETGELDEEESSLSRLSGGRAMKTYSKKQNATVDNETDNEGTGEGADYRAWKKAVMLVYNRLAQHKYASIFLRPITEDQAPGYHSVMFRPMDLSTIKKNIDNGTIRSTMHFQRDVMLMFQNAIMYNKHDTFIYKMAVSMQEECLQHMQILVQVTGEGTFRRETRTAASSNSEMNESSLIKRKRSHITPSPHDTESPRSKKRRKSEND